MTIQNPITKLTQTLKRDDGTEVKLVASGYYGRGLHLSVGVDVFRRETPEQNWVLCGDRPHPDSRQMSRSEYLEHGRPERLSYVTIGEILKISNAIGKPMAFMETFNKPPASQPQFTA